MDEMNRKIIKEGLAEFFGSIMIVEKRSKSLRPKGYAAATIRDVLSGRRNNEALLKLCAEVLLELKQQKAQVNIHLDNIINQIQSL